MNRNDLRQLGLSRKHLELFFFGLCAMEIDETLNTNIGKIKKKKENMFELIIDEETHGKLVEQFTDSDDNGLNIEKDLL